MADRERAHPALWALRGAWFALAVTVGPALAAALDDRSRAVQVVVSVGAWTAWGGGLVASLVPRATSLTALRVVAPGSLAIAGWSALAPGADSPGSALAVATGAVVVATVAAPPVVDAFVDGSSYGAERRFALRTPPLLGLFAALGWLAVAGAAVTGPLLLAAEQWAAGAVAVIAGAPILFLAVRSLHQLARRWVVFVPSGFVVHDPVARPESVMAPRPLIEAIAPALEGSDALDLTMGAPGLVLELACSEPLPVTVRAASGGLGTVEARRIAFTPLRPAAVLTEATRRRLA